MTVHCSIRDVLKSKKRKKETNNIRDDRKPSQNPTTTLSPFEMNIHEMS